jgi:hypothetical protein
MAGFLRKKLGQDAKSANLTQEATNNSTTVPPLFARFAVTNQATPERNTQRIVSSPMQLSSAVRREGASASSSKRNPGVETRVVTTGRRDDGEVDQKQRRGQVKQPFAAVLTPDTSSSVVTSNNRARAQLASSRPQPREVSPAHSPRPISRALMLEKPLPPTVPPTFPFAADPLTTSPPPSSLPANRRTSNRTPPTTYQHRQHERLLTPSNTDDKPLPKLASPTKLMTPSPKADDLQSSYAEPPRNDRRTNLTSSNLSPSRPIPKPPKPEKGLPSQLGSKEASLSSRKILPPVPSSYNRHIPTSPTHDSPSEPLTSQSSTSSSSRQDLHNKQPAATDPVNSGPTTTFMSVSRKSSVTRDEPVVVPSPSAHRIISPAASYGSLSNDRQSKPAEPISIPGSPIVPLRKIGSFQVIIFNSWL